jgi:CheY-like chemotaxis protein
LEPGDAHWGALRDAVRGCVKASELTQQLLSYAGKLHLNTRPLDVSSLVREISDLIRTSVNRNVGLQLDLCDSLPAVEGDGSKLQQVIMNLVINAAEAMEGFSGSVVVATRFEEIEERVFVAVTVKDSGCGMDEATLARIFDPFFTTKFLGRGLGLAAVQGIVRSHSGTLTVESKPGHGTTFKLLLPVLESPPPSAPPLAEAVPEDVRGTGTILVVDDEETVRSVARRALEKYGYKPVIAEDGVAALEIFRANGGRFDLVLLDLTMPGLSGAQVLPLLREINRDVPVIVSTGYDTAEVGGRMGASTVDFLQKPYTGLQLAEKIRGVLKAGKRN